MDGGTPTSYGTLGRSVNYLHTQSKNAAFILHYQKLVSLSKVHIPVYYPNKPELFPRPNFPHHPHPQKKMVKIIYGCASIAYQPEEQREKIISILLSHNITHLDTARLYQGSEAALGALTQRPKFTIDTKLVGGFGSGGSDSESSTKEGVIQACTDSQSRVNIPQFDVLYLHAPDISVPITETLAGVNEAHKQGIFRRFGLSNFSPEQVQQVYDVCVSKGYVAPSVFQGNYSPIARHSETMLFPTLRRLGMSFYAYSPLAGGFLTKTAEELDAGKGRFNQNVIGGLYSKLYDNEVTRQALVTWNRIAEKEGVSKAELAYRWVAYHSVLSGDEDGVIFGASSVAQVEQTAQGLKKGKLSDEAVQGIEEIWQSVKSVAPIDNFQGKPKV
ncbi:Aldo/keto reductase [Decorospora gaudefroyi]|uniref:Aldo/keto reductase n=1 Tax=Decorospora gaudefroyi TaxID=184978 RepID=A0A6A5K8L2_9PLEO|nr:Aldo/keto reductase [Decorospora gaudefroyi]